MTQLLKITSLFALALVFTAGMAFGQSNTSTIDQVGDDIDATVTQTGEGNYSELNQSSDFITGHSATITQIGAGNYSAINTQNGGGTANVFMKGDGNQLLNDDLDSESAANQKNSLTSFDLDIVGDQNRVGMKQEFGDGEITLRGDDNDVTLRQMAGANYQAEDFHTARINVDGSTNTIDVQQGPDFGTGGTNNFATVDLLNGSDGNTVDVLQKSSDNVSTITVDGAGNSATVMQTGGLQ